MRMDLGMGGVDHQPFEVWFGDQRFKQLRPHALVPPPAKASVGVFPITVIRWQVTPRGACTQDPEYRIDKQAIIFGDATPDAPASGQQRLKQKPDSV